MPSIGFGPLLVSLSFMVTVAELGVPQPSPSCVTQRNSKALSYTLRISIIDDGIEMVFEVSPTAKRMVPTNARYVAARGGHAITPLQLVNAAVSLVDVINCRRARCVA